MFFFFVCLFVDRCCHFGELLGYVVEKKREQVEFTYFFFFFLLKKKKKKKRRKKKKKRAETFDDKGWCQEVPYESAAREFSLSLLVIPLS